MNLNTVTSVRRPTSMDEIGPWRPGYAWLAGGTWLFSEPQPAVDTLIDLDPLGWPPLRHPQAGLEIAATCRIAELYRFEAPANWTAAPLLRDCCDALLASFKIWNAATVGGNICMSLPAGPMISLTAALEASTRSGRATRRRARCRLSTSSPATIRMSCAPASCCAASTCPPRHLPKRFALRQLSLTKLGRSAALLIGTRAAAARLPADDHRRHAAAGPSPLRSQRRPRRIARRRSTSASPPTATSTTSMGRRRTSAT